MNELLEWEEQANWALSEAKEFLDIERDIIKKEHLLLDRLQALSHVFAHLDEIIEDSEANAILGKIAYFFHLIDRKVDRLKLRGLKLMKEENHIIDKVSGYISFREWRAAVHQLPEEELVQSTAIRLHKRDLRWLFNKFSAMTNLIDELFNKLQKSGVWAQAEPYVNQFNNIIKFYERLFWNLLLKERELHKRLKEKSKMSS